VTVERAAAFHAQGQLATANMRPAQGARLLRLALRQLDQLANSQRAATGGIRARILLTLAYAEVDQGRIGLGRRLLDEAETLLPPGERGVLYSQRGIFLSRIGRDKEAMAQYDAAVAILRERSEPEVLARSLLNRGNLHMSMAQARPARADFHRCIQVATRAGFHRIIPIARHSLGYLDFLAGNIPAALRTYREVASEYASIKPGLLPVLALDRARALNAAGLFREAEHDLASAALQFRGHRLGQDYAETQLTRAETALLAGDPVATRRLAHAARAVFRRRENHRWAALATLLVLRAEFALGRRRGLSNSAQDLAATLESLGLGEDARMARLIAARSWARSGQAGRGTEQVGALRPPTRADRLDTRLLWRLTSAELAAATGRRADAARHLESGMVELQRYRTQFGCLDLQTGAAVHGLDLARAGLAAAVRGGACAAVYRWSELARAQALLLPPVRPPEDPEAAAALEELRQVRGVFRRAELAGHPTGALRNRARALQRTIREHAWSTSGSGIAAKPASYSAIRAELGGAAMVIYLRDGQLLLALTIVDRSARLVPLGAYAEVKEAVHRLRADLDAAAGRTLPTRMAVALAAATSRDADALAAAIVGPLLPHLGDRDLVVVPTGVLVTVPWATLPGCVGRPVTVALSATTWRAGRVQLNLPRAKTVLLVAGPGNDRAEPEVSEIAATTSHATVLTGERATPAAALAGMDGVGLAHIAAHGHHESENPLFSALDLAGGQLMGHDLQHLRRAPTIVVLSACDLGLAEVRPGDETLGMAAALLSIGAGTVIASTSRIADDTAMAVMTRFHRYVHDGTSSAVALAAAVRNMPCPFVCLGAS